MSDNRIKKMNINAEIIQATKKNQPSTVTSLLVRKKYELDKNFSNLWEERDVLYETEKQFVNEIPTDIFPFLKMNPDNFFLLITRIHTDRARVYFFEKMFGNMNIVDADFIANNLPRLVGCFEDLIILYVYY